MTKVFNGYQGIFLRGKGRQGMKLTAYPRASQGEKNY